MPAWTQNLFPISRIELPCSSYLSALRRPPLLAPRADHLRKFKRPPQAQYTLGPPVPYVSNKYTERALLVGGGDKILS